MMGTSHAHVAGAPAAPDRFQVDAVPTKPEAAPTPAPCASGHIVVSILSYHGLAPLIPEVTRNGSTPLRTQTCSQCCRYIASTVWYNSASALPLTPTGHP